MQNLNNYASTFSFLERRRRIQKLKSKLSTLQRDIETLQIASTHDYFSGRKELSMYSTQLELVLIEYEHLRFKWMRSYLNTGQELPEFTTLYDGEIGGTWKI